MEFLSCVRPPLLFQTLSTVRMPIKFPDRYLERKTSSDFWARYKIRPSGYVSDVECQKNRILTLQCTEDPKKAYRDPLQLSKRKRSDTYVRLHHHHEKIQKRQHFVGGDDRHNFKL
jgi:hypothetical protein